MVDAILEYPEIKIFSNIYIQKLDIMTANQERFGQLLNAQLATE